MATTPKEYCALANKENINRAITKRRYAQERLVALEAALRYFDDEYSNIKITIGKVEKENTQLRWEKRCMEGKMIRIVESTN